MHVEGPIKMFQAAVLHIMIIIYLLVLNIDKRPKASELCQDRWLNTGRNGVNMPAYKNIQNFLSGSGITLA